MKIDSNDFRVREGDDVDLGKWPTRGKPLCKSKKAYRKLLQQHIEQLSGYQELLYPSNSHALLLIFHAIDAAGKDGAIKHVMSGVNPQGCQMFSFRHPSALELQHDFLWRTTRDLPERGRIGIFNRSIVDLERHLHANGARIVKVFLHLSRDEQRKRFLERIDEPAKNWKFSAADLKERKFWNDYMRAYGQCLGATSTADCPWHVVPADDKDGARAIVSRLVLDALEKMDMAAPVSSPARKRELQALRRSLFNQPQAGAVGANTSSASNFAEACPASI